MLSRLSCVGGWTEGCESITVVGHTQNGSTGGTFPGLLGTCELKQVEACHLNPALKGLCYLIKADMRADREAAARSRRMANL